MTIQPTVSILMPVFNEEKHLNECLLSIINQDFKNWELIVVDDFSSDSSFQILGQYCNLDARITLLHNNSKGIIPALKTAFANSNGIFITRMDADDIMPVQKLSVMVKSLEAYGLGHIVSGKVEYFSNETLGDGYKNYEEWINKQLYYQEIYKECTLPSACWMAYKSDLEQLSAFSTSNYPEDYDLLFRFYEHGLNIKGIDQVLHLWRDHPDRASRNDPNYQDQNFFHLKVDYFSKIDYNPRKDLFLWGAGKKGKSLAKRLQEKKLPFTWVTGNAKKIGKHIYGVLMKDTEELNSAQKKQVIIAISDRQFTDNKEKILAGFSSESNQLFEFC